MRPGVIRTAGCQARLTSRRTGIRLRSWCPPLPDKMSRAPSSMRTLCRGIVSLPPRATVMVMIRRGRRQSPAVLRTPPTPSTSRRHLGHATPKWPRRRPAASCLRRNTARSVDEKTTECVPLCWSLMAYRPHATDRARSRYVAHTLPIESAHGISYRFKNPIFDPILQANIIKSKQ